MTSCFVVTRVAYPVSVSPAIGRAAYANLVEDLSGCFSREAARRLQTQSVSCVLNLGVLDCCPDAALPDEGPCVAHFQNINGG